MVKIQEVKDRFFCSIPKEYIAQARWKKGDQVTVSFNERGNIELKKVER